MFFSSTFGFFSHEKNISFSRLTCKFRIQCFQHVNLEKGIFFSREKNPKVKEKNIVDVFSLVFFKILDPELDQYL